MGHNPRLAAIIASVRWWTLATGVLLSVPAWVLLSLNTGGTVEELLEQLTYTVVAGVLLTGAGSALRAAVHGGSKFADGIGKLLGVAGWGVSLAAAIVFAIQRVGFDGRAWMLGAIIAGTFVVALVVIGCAFWPRRPKTDR